MEFLDKKDQHTHNSSDAGHFAEGRPFDSVGSQKGSSIQESDFNQKLDKALTDDHNHAPDTSGNSSNHVSLSNVDSARNLDVSKLRQEFRLDDNVGKKGDLLIPGGGKNTVIGSGDDDTVLGNAGGTNTITLGFGRDTIVLGAETTNRVFDFNPNEDRIVFDRSLDPNNIVIAQGKNPNKGGLNQPLDSVNNVLIIDKSSEHILASLAFNKVGDFGNFEDKDSFSQLNDEALGTLNNVKFDVQEGNGKLTGGKKSDKLVGGGGDDFLYVGDDGFKIGKATASSGGDEFPFPNDSLGSSEAKADFKDGVLSVTGSYKNFDGLPLFSQGETTIDPSAKILNGSDPQALIDGFLKVPQDSEGNKISGTHLHFSPSGDSRGNFADATVIRYFDNVSTDAKSGTITGRFNLSPDEQAAFLAGDLYMNIHTNVDGDKDGKGGFPTGENRLNFNQNVVQIA